MMHEAPPIAARLWPPRPALAGCFFAGIERDTRHLTLTHQDRFNFFPAAPLCSVTLMIDGQGYLVAGETPTPETGQPLPRLSFSGPQSRPVISWNPGPIHALTIGFYPDAWRSLSGQEVTPHVNKTLPLEEVITGQLLLAFQKALSPLAPEARMIQLQDRLSALWQDHRPPGHPLTHHLSDWSHAIAQRAFTSRLGRSTRQVQRRIKSWTGLNHQQLRDLARNEALFARVRSTAQPDTLNLAQLADASGFSDQAHMGRHVRRLTGHSPARLNHRIAQDEAFWCYRLLGERY